MKNDDITNFSEEDYIKNIDFEKDYTHCNEMCDWCGIRPVSYHDAAYSLCEGCSDQLLGY